MMTAMKNIIKLTLSVVVAALVISSCTTSTGDVSRITFFPDFVMNGDAYIILQTGDDWTDPGVTATEGGEEIPVASSGVVDPSTPGVYVITYSATNSDGFDGTVQRTVRVVTPGTDIDDISGSYDGLRLNRSLGGTVVITKIAPGVFECTDFMGGYYAFGVSFGTAYQTNGILTQNADASWTSSQGFNPGFGLIGEAVNISYDAATGTFNWFANFPEVDFGFDVSLTLQTE